MKKLLALLLVMVLALTVLAACGNKNQGDDEETAIESAIAYVSAMYKGGKEVTASDYTVIAKAPGNDGNYYDVVWTTDCDEITVTVDTAKGLATIALPGEPLADIAYVLTATITDAEGNSVSTTFNRKVPKFKTITWDEFVAADKESSVAIDGVISAILSKSLSDSTNGLYVQSEDGGYYVYGMTEDPLTELNLALGMTVRVKGVKDDYNGTLEVVNASVTVISDEITPVTPVDFTEIYKNAADLKATELVYKQGMLVTVKGVTIGGQATDNGYYYFKLGELESYIRISSSVCPLNADDTAAFKTLHAEKKGFTADVTGVICLYNGAFYLTPVTLDTAISNISLPERTDAEKIALELEALNVVDSISKATDIELPLAGVTYPDDVTIAWAIDNDSFTIGEDGKLSLTIGDAEVVVTLTATATCGEATATKTFTIKISASVVLSETVAYIPYVNQVNVGKALYLTGEVSTRYLVTTDNPADAVAVYAEKAEGGYKFYILVEDVKQYITVYKNADGKDSVNYDANGQTVFSYNSAVNAWVTTLEGVDVYLGMYNAFETVSVSKLSFITPENTGVSQFPLEYLVVAPEIANKGCVNQVNVDKVLYLTGEVSTRYLVTTDNPADAIAVYAEKVAGGYKFYILVEDVKQYITVYKNADGKDSVNYDANGQTVFNYNSTVNAWVTTLEGVDVYLGMYNAFETVSVSKLSFITPENTGVSQFPLEFVLNAVEAPETPDEPENPEEPENPDEPEIPSYTVIDTPAVDTAYKFGMVQGNLENAVYYLKGGMNGYYLETTGNPLEALDVYLEATEGGYYLYCYVEGVKTYINYTVSGTYVNAAYEATAVTVYTYDAEKKTVVSYVNDAAYWIGTRNDKTYTTVGPVKVEYDGFYCQFYTEVDAPAEPETDPIKESLNAIMTKFGEYDLWFLKSEGVYFVNVYGTGFDLYFTYEVTDADGDGTYEFVLTYYARPDMEYGADKASDITALEITATYDGTEWVFPTIEVEPNGSMDYPYELDMSLESQLCTYPGGYAPIFYKFMVRMGGYVTVTSTYENAHITVGIDSGLNVATNEMGVAKYYIPAGGTCYIQIMDNDNEAAEIPFVVTFEPFFSDDYSALVETWVAQVENENGVANYTLVIDQYGTGTYTVQYSADYIETYTLNYLVLSGSELILGLQNEYDYVKVIIAKYENGTISYQESMHDPVVSFVIGEPVVVPPVSGEGSLAINDNIPVDAEDAVYTYTATEAGTLTLTTGAAINGEVVFTYTVNGGAAVTIGLSSTATITLVAGDTVVVTITANGAYSSLTTAWAAGATTDTPTVPVEPEKVVFDFGANDETVTDHVDGRNDLSGKTQTYTSGNYELVLTDITKVYADSFDKTGNSALKFGTGSVAGEMTFVVPDEVTSVVIYAARYKSYADNSTMNVNGTVYTLANNSNDGTYEAITIDTTTVKTITITSACTSGKPRIMINTIEFVITKAN